MRYIKNAEVGERAWVAPGACLVGKVVVGPDCGVWYNAVIRGDEDRVTIGRGSNIQDNVVIHADHGYPCRVGEGVTIGHAAIVHGCTIGDNVLVGMGSVIMNGAVIGRDCIIGAGSLVTGKTQIPEGMLALGRPAKVVRPLTEEEKEGNKKSSRDYIDLKNIHEKLA